MVDEKDAVQMIHLMLNAGRKKAVRLDDLFLAMVIKKADSARRGALDFLEKFRNREAAFLIEACFRRRIEDFGIDEIERSRFFVFAGKIHDDDALRDVNLDRRKADALGLVHRLQHIVHQSSDAVINNLYGR